MKTTVFFKKKKIGVVDSERNAYLTYRNDNHVFHKFGEGFGVSIGVLDLLRQKEIEYVIVNFKNMKAYVAQTVDFLVLGEDYKDGNDVQLILPLKYWNKKPMEEFQSALF